MNIALVPARCGSKSIPYKNIKEFCGKPLLYWTLAELEKASSIDIVYVATDCEEIKAVTNTFRFSKVNIYNRSKANAEDHSSTESLLKEFVTASHLKEKDYVVLSQVTNPFVKSKYFDEAFDLLINSSYDSILTCARIKRFFWEEDGKPINYDFTKRPRRQDFAGSFIENGAFYINSVYNIRQNNNRLFGNIGIYEMPTYSQLELDEPEDWLYAEQVMFAKHLETLDKPKVKLLAMDVDGVLTDAGMYYTETGDELKKFNTLDGKGLELIRGQGIKTAIITSEDTIIVKNRAKKLKVNHVHQGVTDKLLVLKEICKIEKIKLEEVAYIGDDINDYEPLLNVGLGACPANAVPTVKNISQIIKLQERGGGGAVREFCEIILKAYKENQ